MTRETKISLLVGLAFIIVMGILLTDHMVGGRAAAGGASGCGRGGSAGGECAGNG